jgi:predicted DNA-binding transcriptional regulator AlpA
MKPLLTILDLVNLLRVSESTLRRWIAESRRGLNSFPKPVNGFKRKLLWHPVDIELWMTAGRQQQPVPNFGSPTERKKRHTAAMSRLQSKGVKIASK